MKYTDKFDKKLEDTPIFREMVKENKHGLDFKEVAPNRWVLNRVEKEEANGSISLEQKTRKGEQTT